MSFKNNEYDINLHVFGIDYKSDDFKLRQQFAFNISEITISLQRLYESGIVTEALILSTCNRTEIYFIAADIDFVINSVCSIKNICPRLIRKKTYSYHNKDCVRHLFRVISGLESMVLGEHEIVSQIKQAITLAKEAGTCGSLLNGVFHMALNTSKEFRTISQINNVSVSIGSACLNLVQDFYIKSLSCLSKTSNNINKNILFVGAGQMIQQILPYFNKYDFSSLTIANRTVLNANNLIHKLSVLKTKFEAVSLDYISKTNFYNNSSNINPQVIIISCYSDYILLNEVVLNYYINNHDIKLLIIDLSMPLLTDKLILSKYDNITILTIDDIGKIVDVGIEKRKIFANMTHDIIENKLIEYESWLKKRNLSPIIKAMRDDANCIRQDVLNVALKELELQYDPKLVLENLSIRLTNKLLHTPTVKLCASNNTALNDNLVDLVNHLYDLNTLDSITKNANDA